jgi:alkaline phosphatase D
MVGNEMRFGLGSCLDQDVPQPIWESIEKDNIDGFIFLGDNVYGDSPSLELKKMARAYKKQKEVLPKWLRSKEIMTIWDDHDYGQNDGGGDYYLKEEAQKLFLDFWEIPKSDPRHLRKGIYFDRIKKIDGINVHFIGLDTRFFRSELKGSKKLYKDNTDIGATVLGKKQWSWLERAIHNNESDLVILLTSIQLLATEHRFEKWSNFSLERERLINLIEASGKQVVVISGDRHRGGIYKYNKIYEITASSMNKPGSSNKETDRLLIGKTYNEENYGVLSINPLKKEIKLFLKDLKGKILESVVIPFEEIN